MAGMTADEVYVLLGDEITLLTEEVKQMEGWEPIEHKGTVQTAEDLPADAKKGWMYNIATDSVYGAAGMNVVMTSKGWDPMGPIINMNLYLTKEEGTKSFQPKGNYLSGTDTDLKESGKAADAKATGEKIAKNSSDIAKKLGKNQGSENSGKVAGINEVGDIVPMFPMGVEYNSETNCLEFGSDQKMKLNQGIGLDNTLTKSGSAADAGVTGKKIDSLKEDIKEQTGSYLQGKQLFDANDFSVGACTSGLKTESQFRITNAKETFEKATPIKCKLGDTLNINVDLADSDFIGCRVGIHEISDSYFVFDSGWLQVTNKGVAYTVAHKSTVGVNVTFSFSKSSNTVITNSTEYTGELTLDGLLSNIKISVVMGDNVVSNVQLGEMYNNLKKAITIPGMIYKSDPAFDIFLNAESKYRLQGCAVGKGFLYYSMTEQDTSNSYIYKASLSNGELVSSSTGKYGHAGDMTFNPNTNEIITLTAETSYTDLFILDADTLSLKKTIRINTEGWRLAAIAYNPYTKGYVAEFAKNNTWSEYKFAFTDSNFAVLSEFDSIKLGYTLQGIECDGKYIYAMYAYPNIVIVYSINGAYVGYIKIPFATESECITKQNDILFIGEGGEKKIYKAQLLYEWDN